MNSPTSYFSISLPLIRENLRRFWAIPAISFLIYFLSGVFPILISYSKIDIVASYINMSLTNMQPFYMAAHLIIPVITAVVIFRYLQSGSSSTMMHAMPFSRFKLYNSNLVSGLLLILTPVLLNGLILLAIAKPAKNTWGMDPAGVAGAVDVFTRSAVLNWMWQSVMILLVVYAISIFAGLVTANSIMHFATALGFNFLIPSLFAIFVYYFGTYLYGFNVTGDWGNTCLSISPYLETFNLNNEGGNFPPLHQLYYLLNAMLLFVVSSYLYAKRKLEKAGDSLAFEFMIPIICYLVAFFGMTLLGFWFQALNQDSEFYAYAGYGAGALIFFIIGRMIVMKTPRVFNLKSIRSFALYILMAAIFFSGLSFDITGFEKRVPAPGKVSSASFENSFLQGNYSQYYSGYYAEVPESDKYKMKAGLKSADNINSLTALHQAILENRSGFEANKDKLIQYNVGFDYSVGSLSKLQRIYAVDYLFLKNSKEMATIYESSEFKKMYSLSNLDYDKITSITFSNPANYDSPVTITNPKDIAVLFTLMDQDYANETYTEAMNLDWPYAIANINYKMRHQSSNGIVDYSTDLVIRESYTKTISWLTDNGYSEKIALTDEMISYISVYSPTLNNPGETNAYLSAPDKYVTDSASLSPAVEFKITDKAQIAEAMKAGKSQNISFSGYYSGTIYYNYPGKTGADGYEVAQQIYFNPGEIPDFITNYFK